MDDVTTYHLQVRGPLAVEDIESFSPPGITSQQMAGNKTCLVVRTDQSGVIGLIRHLHRLGCVLLFFERKEIDGSDSNKK